MIGRLRAALRPAGTTGDEGQIFPVLVVAVLALIVAGWLFAQVGSASDGKSRAQSAADAAALAASRAFRDSLLASFEGGVPANPFGVAAAAAQLAAVQYADDNDADLDQADVVVTRAAAGVVQIEVDNVQTRQAVIAGPATADQPGPRATAAATATLALNVTGLCAAYADDGFVASFLSVFGISCPPPIVSPPPAPSSGPPVPPVSAPPAPSETAPPVPFGPLLSIRLTA